MSKVTIDAITSGYNLSKINANFVLLQDELNNNVLYRTNPMGEPNSMSNDIDMNSKDILNTNVVAAQSVTIGGVSVVPGDTLSVPNATSVPFAPTGSISSIDVQNAIAEVDSEKMTLIATPVAGDIVLQAATGELTKAGFALPNVNGDVNASNEELNFSVGLTSNIQTQLDAIEATSSFKGALVYNSINQSITTSGAAQELLFDSESYDTNDIHDTVTNNTRLTVPTGVTKVRIVAKSTFAPSTVGYRNLQIRKNGSATFDGYVSEQFDAVSDGSAFTILNISSPIITVSATDYFECTVFQTSGGALNVQGNSASTWFSMEIIE